MYRPCLLRPERACSIATLAPAGYEASLPHELVHVFTRELWANPKATDAQLFFHEGVAEALAVEAGLGSTGFPLYGHSVDVAAGSFLSAGQGLPIQSLVL